MDPCKGIIFCLFAVSSYAENPVVPGVKITSMQVESRINARLARVLVTTQFKNYNEKSHETQFTFQLPETAFISKFSMTVGNKTIHGFVKEKKAANKVYENSKQQGVSAAKVDHKNDVPNREMKIFTVTVNTAARSKAVFKLQYHEVLQRKLGRYKQRISFHPQQVVQDIVFKAKIYEQEGIKEFQYTLPGSNVSESSSTDFALLKASDNTRELYFKPPTQHQAEDDQSDGFSGEIVLAYDVAHNNVGGIILQENDFFVHYLAPEGFSVLEKNIVFVIDKSGSMSGFKMEQTRNAMMIILDKLRAGDYFNILLFDNEIELWITEPIPVNKNNKRRAKLFVRDKLHARGGTDINSALLKSISLLNLTHGLGGTRGNMIVFLTDGNPTSGLTDIKRLRQGVAEVNKNRFSLFSLGFGFDVDMSFLKALSWENGGFSRRIYEETDASLQLQNFYNELQDPTLLNVNIIYENNATEMMSLTQTAFPQYFKGTEMIIAGKLKDRARLDWKASVIGRGLIDDLNIDVKPTSWYVDGNNTEISVMEKLWAYMKINDLLKEIAIADDLETKEMLKNKTLAMSLQYHFVTPLTSMVVSEIQVSTLEESERKEEKISHILASSRISNGNSKKDGITIFFSILISFCIYGSKH